MSPFLTALSGIGSKIADLAAPVLSYIGNRENNKSALQLQQNNNDFNMQQYEDWKYYNSIDQQVKRARAAGMNPYNIGVSNTLPSALQRENTVVDQSPFSAAADALGLSLSRKMKRQQQNLAKEQFYADLDYKKQMIELQKFTAESMKNYRDSMIGFNYDKLSKQDAWHTDDLGLRRDSLLFKNLFYTDSRFPGYWDTQLKKQNYEFYGKYNPIRQGIGSARLEQMRTWNNNLQSYIDARIAGLAANASISQLNYAKYNSIFDADLATQQAVLEQKEKEARLNSNPVIMGLKTVFGLAGQAANAYSAFRGRPVPQVQSQGGFSVPSPYFEYNMSY